MEWIKTSERLPEYEKRVLIRMKYDFEILIAIRCVDGWQAIMPEMGEIKGNAYYDGFFKDDQREAVIVEYWMPLPEPPKDTE